MTFILVCGGNARRLGIADDQGDWDYALFMKHAEGCPECAGFVGELAPAARDALERLLESDL